MDDEVYDSFKPTSVKPTVREYKVRPDYPFQSDSDFLREFTNLVNSIHNSRKKLNLILTKMNKWKKRPEKGNLPLLTRKLNDYLKNKEREQMRS